MGRVARAARRGGASQLDRGAAPARARLGGRRVQRLTSDPVPPRAVRPQRPAGPQGQPDLRRLGHRRGGRGLPGRRRLLQRLHRRAVRSSSSPGPTHERRSTGALDRGTCPTSSWSARSDLADLRERGRSQPVGEPARRARRRLRRRLLPRRARGVRRGPRPAVHALRHLADGHLLQHRARRLRGDGPTAGSTSRSSTTTPRSRRWTLRAVPGRRRVRQSRRGEASPASTIEPTLRGLAPFIYSGGGKVFDDDDEPTSLAFSSDDTTAALEPDAAAAARPHADAPAEQLAEKRPLELVQARASSA